MPSASLHDRRRVIARPRRAILTHLCILLTQRNSTHGTARVHRVAAKMALAHECVSRALPADLHHRQCLIAPPHVVTAAAGKAATTTSLRGGFFTQKAFFMYW